MALGFGATWHHKGNHLERYDQRMSSDVPDAEGEGGSDETSNSMMRAAQRA